MRGRRCARPPAAPPPQAFASWTAASRRVAGEARRGRIRVRLRGPAGAHQARARGSTIEGEEYFYSGPLSFDWTSDTVSVLVYQEPRPSDGAILTGLDDPAAGEGLQRRRRFGVASCSPARTRRWQTAPTGSRSPPPWTPPRSSSSDAGGRSRPRERWTSTSSFSEGAGLEDGCAGAGGRGCSRRPSPRPGSGRHGDASTRSPAPRTCSRCPPTLRPARCCGRCTPISNLAANPVACNIFFVREITDDEERRALRDLAGHSGRPHHSGHDQLGVVINVSAHQTAGGFDGRELGQTITHETGHSLGLYHTSEQDAVAPRHHLGHARVRRGGAAGRGRLSRTAPTSCSGPGGTSQVTPGQSYVMLRSPVVR